MINFRAAGPSTTLPGKSSSKAAPAPVGSMPLPHLYQQISQQMLGGQMLSNPQQAQQLLKVLAAQQLTAQQVSQQENSFGLGMLILKGVNMIA